ncbi:MAG: bifunctional 5,10-methylene-tetrahydrofolate dehydrogenase/5,10-methylene-tetrahydrofolate cyclohydrolase [Gemmatimonadetes bacterium]|nr:bifunctional 5,10-methylene-tetrahydrofolate dehydrogenase/5,10-methylene-tetrahydrofolate cyclohydrolase [Gemmatimonadota bacterium]
MAGKIISGTEVAEVIHTEIKKEVADLKSRGITPGLAVVLVGEDSASKVYVAMKEKTANSLSITSKQLSFPEDTDSKELEGVIAGLNSDPEIHGILIQLPLPRHIDEKVVLSCIDPHKDVDGFHPMNVGNLSLGRTDAVAPCTPVGVIELLIRNGIDPEGKHVVIVGRSNIVGRPLATLLTGRGRGGNATVTIAHSRSEDLPSITKRADILISAVGRADLIDSTMVKPGAIVIDVGVNRVPDDLAPNGYRLVGDVAFEEVSELAGAITPVPGGVGPMTIAMLMKNTVQLANRSLEYKGQDY